MGYLIQVRSLEYEISLTPVLSYVHESPSLTSFHPIRIEPLTGDWQCGGRQQQQPLLCGACSTPSSLIERENHSAIVLSNFGLANLLLSKVTKVALAPARLHKCALSVLHIASVVVGSLDHRTHTSNPDGVAATTEYDLLQLLSLILHATIQVHVESSNDHCALAVFECYEHVRRALSEGARGRATDPRWWHLFLTRAVAPAA